jgi:hypothetical protein
MNSVDQRKKNDLLSAISYTYTDGHGYKGTRRTCALLVQANEKDFPLFSKLDPVQCYVRTDF